MQAGQKHPDIWPFHSWQTWLLCKQMSQSAQQLSLLLIIVYMLAKEQEMSF